MPPKGILKKSSRQDTSSVSVVDPSNAPQQVTARHRDIAVQHAQLLQQRKDVEAANLDAVEELMEFPTDPSADPARPQGADVARFRQLVASFQPSDYDALFEERNCLDKCAYVFCPRTRRLQSGSGSVRLKPGGRNNTKFLSSKQVGMWCSDACARRALYVKVQLSEQPAWERSGGYARPIDLLDEEQEARLKDKVGQNSIGDDDDGTVLHKAIQDLAFERGERTTSKKPTMVLAERIKESQPSAGAQPPEMDDEIGDAIEGYAPKTRPSQNVVT